MIWIDLIKALDEIRSAIRQTSEFQKSPRAVVSSLHEIVTQVKKMADSLEFEDGPKAVTVELDATGRPIITDDLKDLFAIAPVEENPVVATNRLSAGVIRRNPPQGGAKLAQTSEPKATVIPREDSMKHVNHPPKLEDATADTVAK